jgi:hypothetical protein
VAPLQVALASTFGPLRIDEIFVTLRQQLAAWAPEPGELLPQG